MQKTLADFRNEISAKLSLNLNDAGELALIDGWVNDGIEEVVGQTEARVGIATADLTAGDGDYELDSAIMRLLWIESAEGGSSLDWEPSSPNDILTARLNASSGSPVRRYAVDGANMLMVFPIPESDTSITMRYVPRPAALIDPDDTPTDIPGEFHKLVTLYALWQGGDYDDDQTSAQGSRYQQLFEAGIVDMRSRINKKRGRRLPRAHVSRRRGHRIPYRNDVDI